MEQNQKSAKHGMDERIFQQRIHKNRQYFRNVDWTTDKVQEEITEGLNFLNKYPNPIVSVLGGARVKPGGEHYQKAYETGKALGMDGFAILTGGGIGIMEAANRGASDAHGVSLGIKAELIHGEQVKGAIHTDSISLHFIFVRRFLLAIKSQALIFFPGGYGTLSEFFEFLVLMKLQIGDEVPLIFVNEEYWKGLMDWMHGQPHDEGLLATDIYDIPTLRFANDVPEIVRQVKECC